MMAPVNHQLCMARRAPLTVLLLVFVFVASSNGGLMYWTDNGSIYRSNVDGSAVEKVYSGSVADGVVVNIDIDPVNQQLYSYGRIGQLYQGSTQFIRRSNLDGSGLETLSKTGDSDPSVPVLLYGFALDRLNGRIYMGTDLRRSNLDGSGIEQLPPYYPNHPYYPHDIEIDTAASRLYYTDAVSYNGIKRAHLDGTSVENVLDLGVGDSQSTYIALDAEDGWAYYTQYRSATLGRVNLSTLANETLLTGMYGWDIELDTSNGKIYWMSDTHIMRANLDGSGVESLVAREFGGPVGAATAGGNLSLFLPTQAVPEPSSLALCSTFTVCGLGLRWWRKRRVTTKDA